MTLRSGQCRRFFETYVFVAGIFEVVWITGIKYADGFTRLWPSVGTVVAMNVSMVCLSLAVRVIPDRDDVCRLDRDWRGGHLLFIVLIVSGVVGLKLSTPD